MNVRFAKTRMRALASPGRLCRSMSGMCRSVHGGVQTAQLGRLSQRRIRRDGKEVLAPRQGHSLADVELRVEAQACGLERGWCALLCDGELADVQAIELLRCPIGC